MKIWSAAASVAALCLAVFSASAQTTIHVPADKPTIQAAINASVSGGTVVVSPGTYFENLDFGGRNIAVTSSDGPATTILDGSNTSPVVQFTNGETSGAQLRGFTIQHGHPLTTMYSGGGVYIHNASPNILNNVITENACAGIAVQGGGPELVGNTVSATHTFSPLIQCEYPGTAVLLFGAAQAQVTKNNIINNVEASWGALLIWASSDSLVENNIFTGNNVPSGFSGCGGALCMVNSFTATIVGNYVSGNSNTSGSAPSQAMSFDLITLPYGGGSNYLSYGAPLLRLLNNTFVNNNSGTSQVYIGNATDRVEIVNNLFAGNAGNPGLSCDSNSTPTILEYNESQDTGLSTNCGNTSGRGNLTVDPQLVQQASGHSAPTNPALIDSAENSVLPQTLLDVDGNVRAQASTTGRIDYGAIETKAATFLPQSKLVVVPVRYEVGSGQTLDVMAAITSTSATPSSTTVHLFVDGNEVQQASIAVPGTAYFTGVPFPAGAGAHSVYVASDAVGDLPAAQSVSRIINRSGVAPVADGARLTVTLTGTNPLQNLHAHLEGATTYGTLRVFDNGNLVTATTLSVTDSDVSLILVSGPHIITADYEGSFASSAVQAVTYAAPVNPENFTLTALPNPSNYGQPVTFNASFTPHDSTISNSRLQITEGSTVYLDTPLDGTGAAHVTTATLVPGLHTLKGSLSYTVTGSSGGFTFTSSGGVSSTLKQTVLAATTTLSLSASPASTAAGASIALKAALSSPYTGAAASGSITFREGSTVLGTGTLSGNVATLTLSNLAVGAHSIAASYGGDTNFQASTSAPVSVTITAAPDFQLTSDANDLSVTLQTQHHKSTTLRLTSDNGFDGTVRIACASLPDVASCSFDATSYALHATNSLPITFTFETSGIPGYLSQRRTNMSPWNTAARLLAILLPLPLLFRKRYTKLALLLLMASTTLALTACSSKYPDHTPPGTYTITLNVTGVSGGTTVTHAVPFVVTVTP